MVDPHRVPENVTHPWSGLLDDEAEAVFANSLPAVHSFMTAHRNELVKRYDQGKYFWELRSCAYWQEFEQPKIIVPAIQNKVDYAPDLAGFYSNDKTSIIVDERWSYLLAVLNSPVSWWLTQQSFASRQGGFFEFKPMYVAQVPIPSSSERKRELIEGPVKAIVACASDNRLEQLLNGFVYELFFREDSHARGLTLFDEAERSGLSRLAGFEGAELVKAAVSFAATQLVPGARLRTMLSDLATLDVVRIIEGRE